MWNLSWFLVTVGFQKLGMMITLLERFPCSPASVEFFGCFDGLDPGFCPSLAEIRSGRSFRVHDTMPCISNSNTDLNQTYQTRLNTGQSQQRRRGWRFCFASCFELRDVFFSWELCEATGRVRFEKWARAQQRVTKFQILVLEHHGERSDVTNGYAHAFCVFFFKN